MKLKISSFVVLLSLSLPRAAFAAETAARPQPPVTAAQSEYAKAVRNYVDAATDQMRAIRMNVDANVEKSPEATKARFKKVYEELEKTDKLLKELKRAGPADFDRIKLEFELTRNKVLKDIDAALK